MYISTVVFLMLKFGIIRPGGWFWNGTDFDIIIFLTFFAIDTISTTLILRWKFHWFN